MQFNQPPKTNTPETSPLRNTSEDLKLEGLLRKLTKEAGINNLINSLSKEALLRLKILMKGSKTVEDEIRGVNLLNTFFKSYNQKNPNNTFSETEIQTAKMGTLLTDIGKTGPYIKELSVDKAREVALCFADIFNNDTHVNTNETSVEEFLKLAFEKKEGLEGVEKRSKLLKIAGINVSMMFREFINKHSKWTLDILKVEGGSIPFQVITAAASHHMLEGQNPAQIERTLSRPEIMIILLDKYDARRRRGGVTHEEAIKWLIDGFEDKDGKHFGGVIIPLKTEERLSAITEEKYPRKVVRDELINEIKKEKENFLNLIEEMRVTFKDSKAYDGIKVGGNGAYQSPK